MIPPSRAASVQEAKPKKGYPGKTSPATADTTGEGEPKPNNTKSLFLHLAEYIYFDTFAGITMFMSAGMNVAYHKSSNQGNECFSILIPSWNNLPYLKLCIESIKKNSAYPHEIIVHVNEGSDGTIDWLKQQAGISFSHTPQNAGVCYALNIIAAMATTDYILYMNDDMYVCPGWDRYLLEEIQAVGHEHFFISATAIEAVPQSRCSIEGDFGRDIGSFNEEKLLSAYAALPMHDWQGATWPPNVVHKNLWNRVGGYSIEFSPGMYSDPDFSMKLWKAGVRYFKGIARSRVYHFGSVSVKRVQKNGGYYTFISKWGITAATFSKYYLRRGAQYNGILTEPKKSNARSLKSLYKRIRAVFNKK
ncbi:MAG: glycosyltransferase [Niabella sp.]